MTIESIKIPNSKNPNPKLPTSTYPSITKYQTISLYTPEGWQIQATTPTGEQYLHNQIFTSQTQAETFAKKIQAHKTLHPQHWDKLTTPA